MMRARAVPTIIHRVIAALTLLFVMSAPVANAQHNPFYDTELALTPEDLQPLEAAASKLLDMERPKIGATANWKNPATGVHGRVTLSGLAALHGLPCRDLRYVIVNPRLARPNDITLDWCRTASGEWKIVQ